MGTALIIIDMQLIMQHRIDAGRGVVNPNAAVAIGALLAAVRDAGWPVVHVRHAEADPASPLHVAAAGYPAMPCAAERDGEPVFVKHSSSAFATTALERYLRDRSITNLHVVGAVAGFCVNSTVRAASDLGFDVSVVRDAIIGFDLPDAGLAAQTIFDVTMALLAADFATILNSSHVLEALSGANRDDRFSTLPRS